MSTSSGVLEAVDRILNRGGDPDDVLRQVVEAVHRVYPYVAIAFVEGGELVVGPEAGGKAFSSVERIQPPRVSVAVAGRSGPVVSTGAGKSARGDAGERSNRHRRCGPVRNRARQPSRPGRFRRDAPDGMEQQRLAPASECACQGQVAGDDGRGRTLAARDC